MFYLHAADLAWRKMFQLHCLVYPALCVGRLRCATAFVTLAGLHRTCRGQLPLHRDGRQGRELWKWKRGRAGRYRKATVFLQAGAVVPIIMGAQGGTSIYVAGGGDGGLSAVYINGANALPTIVAGLRPYFS